MGKPVTVRNPEYVDNRFPELRRGFLDVQTPLCRISELHMPPAEQREFLKAIIAECETRRAELHKAAGGMNKKNLTHAVNKKPGFRQRLRMGHTWNAGPLNKYLELGKRIQELQAMLRQIPKPDRSHLSETGEPS